MEGDGGASGSCRHGAGAGAWRALGVVALASSGGVDARGALHRPGVSSCLAQRWRGRVAGGRSPVAA